ncbi:MULTISPECIES: hypothetical protein [Mesorhizobium]|uniref:hypothetical protein n=1 Tax=Mesorhizobium TaxID=68287 RepID=UPI00296257C6|nr:hypothetical protein [Mesorhizobium sp. B283B1A]
MPAQMVLQEKTIFFRRHPVIEKVAVGARVDVMTVIEVKRQETLAVETLSPADRLGKIGVGIFRGFALNEDGVRSHFEDRPHGKYVRPKQSGLSTIGGGNSRLVLELTLASA